MKKKKPGWWRVLLPHLILVLSSAMLTLFIIDRFNDGMAFLYNDLTKWILAVFAVAAAVFAVVVIVEDEKRRRDASDERDRKGEEK